ncbi:hypothetical protein PG995_005073 [Apiospora arundinis]
MPSEADLDKLFNTERFQEQRQYGLKNWQIGALNEDMAHLPYRGGHSSTYDHAANFEKFKQNTFTVDESKWYRFLRKDRWLDPDDRTLENETRKHIQRWTVNDDKIWGQVKILTEWVYRVLELLIKERDPWLDTVLWGDFMHQDGRDPDPGLRTEPKGMVLRSRTITEILNTSDYANVARERLEHLSRELRLSFLDEWDSEATGGQNMGETCWFMDSTRLNDKGYYYTPVTCISVSFLRGLCHDGPPDVTPAEASFGWFTTSLTLLHELMHAIVYHRRLEKWGPKGLNLAEEAEPYIRDDQLFEAGISLERHLLGGSEVSAASFDFHKTPPGRLNK